MSENAEGEAEVPDATAVWRRVPQWPDWIVFDENLGRLRPSSLAFDDNPDGSAMSAFLDGYGNSIEDVLRGHDGFALAGVSAGLIRSKNLKIVRDPLEGLPAHVEVHGPKTKSIRSALAKAAVWIVAPTEAAV